MVVFQTKIDITAFSELPAIKPSHLIHLVPAPALWLPFLSGLHKPFIWPQNEIHAIFWDQKYHNNGVRRVQLALENGSVNCTPVQIEGSAIHPLTPGHTPSSPWQHQTHSETCTFSPPHVKAGISYNLTTPIQKRKWERKWSRTFSQNESVLTSDSVWPPHDCFLSRKKRGKPRTHPIKVSDHTKHQKVTVRNKDRRSLFFCNLRCCWSRDSRALWMRHASFQWGTFFEMHSKKKRN